MTSAKGGRPQKGAAITEGYNAKKTYRSTPTPRQLAYQRKKQRDAKKAAAAQLAVPVSALDIDSWGLFPEPVPTEDSYELPPPVGAATPTGKRVGSVGSSSAGAAGSETKRGSEDKEGEGDEDNSAEDLMADMRWVYRQLRGREKLKKLMGNDKEFIGLVKELMKLEAVYLTNKMKNKGTGTGQGFLVVLKGLEGDNKLVADMKKDKTIDLKQIERALNPTADLLGPADLDEDQNDAPATIIRKGLTVEQEEELQEGLKPAEEEWP